MQIGRGNVNVVLLIIIIAVIAFFIFADRQSRNDTHEAEIRRRSNEIFEAHFKEAVHETDVFLSSRLPAQEFQKFNDPQFIHMFVHKFCSDVFSWGFHEGLTKSQGRQLTSDERLKIEQAVESYLRELNSLINSRTAYSSTNAVYLQAVRNIYQLGLQKAMAQGNHIAMKS